jgi:hypothetical protein
MTKFGKIARWTLPILGIVAVLSSGRTATSAPAGQVRPSAAAQQLMTTVVTLQKWAEFLYDLRGPAEVCEPFLGEPVFDFLNFTITQEALSDRCTHTLSVLSLLDGAYVQDITYASGLEEHVEAFPLPREGSEQVWSFSHEFSNGNSAEYDLILTLEEIAPEFFITVGQEWVGDFSLGDRSVEFTLERELGFNGPPEDFFEAELPGGTRVELTVPIDPVDNVPNFADEAVGVVTIQGKPFPIRLLSGDGARWTRLRVGNGKKGNSPNGDFLINEDFSGRGQMFKGKKLDFIARWNKNAVATVILPNGQATSAGPIAGLLDFAQLRWSGVASNADPTPGL